MIKNGVSNEEVASAVRKEFKKLSDYEAGRQENL